MVQKCDLRFSSVTMNAAHGAITVTYPNEHGLLACSPKTKTVEAYDINRDGVLDAFVEVPPYDEYLHGAVLWIPKMIQGISGFIEKYEDDSKAEFASEAVACNFELQGAYSMASARLLIARDKFIEKQKAELLPASYVMPTWPSGSLYVTGQNVTYDVRYNHGVTPDAELSSVTLEERDTYELQGSIEIPIGDFQTDLRTAIVDGERERRAYYKRKAEEAKSQHEEGFFVAIANWFR